MAYASDVVWSSGTPYFPHPSFAPSTTPRFELDLGDDYGLSGLVVWGDPRENRNEATDFTLEFSTDGGQSWGIRCKCPRAGCWDRRRRRWTFPAGLSRRTGSGLPSRAMSPAKGTRRASRAGDRVVVGELRFVGRSLPSNTRLARF